jgi:isoamylase
MLSHGDEIGRTQRGNNNAYCQDNDISWMHWTLDGRARELLAFTRQVFAIRRQHPVLRRRSFFRGAPVSGDGVKDVTWLRPDGVEMTAEDWSRPDGHVLGLLIHGESSDEIDDRGRAVAGETLLLVLNAGPAHCAFALPKLGAWQEVVHTAHPGRHAHTASACDLPRWSLALLRLRSGQR